MVSFVQTVIGIVQGVGCGQPNRRDDVKMVQELLNSNQRSMVPLRRLSEDGICLPATIAAIRRFQLSVPNVPFMDGIVQPYSTTLQALKIGAVLVPPKLIGNRLDLATAQDMALQITAVFEGGYKGAAGDGDGQGISFGMIQWNFGQDTLGPLLSKMMAQNSTAFATCFGAEDNYETLRKALTDEDQDAQLSWARDFQKKKPHTWRSPFVKLGSIESFNQIQRQQAKAEYHPRVVRAIKAIRAIDSDLMSNILFKTYSALLDLCVQQGSITKAEAVIRKRVREEKPLSQSYLMKIVVIERGRTAKAASVADCISRRMGILTGAAYTSTEHKITQKRDNPHFNLITAKGQHIVSDL